MVKIVWLLKRAEHLSQQEFEEWWLERHVPVARVAPGLRRYVVSLPRHDELAGKPANDCEWDGVAEQWFADEAAFVEVYGRPAASHTRSDTLAHVSRFERLFVHEINVIE